MDGPGTEGTADFGSAAGIFWQTGFGGHQGQVGHGGSQVQLELAFDAAEVACLADSQLDQPRQPVLHHYPTLTVPGACTINSSGGKSPSSTGSS